MPQLNLLVIDALLKAFGAPRLTELLRKLPLMEREVLVRLTVGGNEASKVMRDVLESFEKLSDGRLRVEVEEGDVEPGYPKPRAEIHGAMGGRLRFYGLIDGILLCPLLEAILYAGGALEPPGLETGSHHVVVYVVPGRPCLVTLRALIPLVPSNEGLRVDVVDAREFERMGGRLPSPYVPAVVVDGRLVRVGSVKSVEEAAELLG